MSTPPIKVDLKRIETLEKDLKEAEQDLKVSDQENSNFRVEVRELKRQNSELEEEVQELRQSKDNLESAKLSQASDRLQHLRKALEDKSREFDSLISELNAMKGKFADMSQVPLEITKQLTQSLEVARTSFSQHDETAGETSTQITSMLERASKHVKDIQNLPEDLSMPAPTHTEATSPRKESQEGTSDNANYPPSDAQRIAQETQVCLHIGAESEACDQTATAMVGATDGRTLNSDVVSSEGPATPTTKTDHFKIGANPDKALSTGPEDPCAEADRSAMGLPFSTFARTDGSSAFSLPNATSSSGDFSVFAPRNSSQIADAGQGTNDVPSPRLEPIEAGAFKLDNIFAERYLAQQKASDLSQEKTDERVVPPSKKATSSRQEPLAESFENLIHHEPAVRAEEPAKIPWNGELFPNRNEFPPRYRKFQDLCPATQTYMLSPDSMFARAAPSMKRSADEDVSQNSFDRYKRRAKG